MNRFLPSLLLSSAVSRDLPCVVSEYVVRMFIQPHSGKLHMKSQITDAARYAVAPCRFAPLEDAERTIKTGQPPEMRMEVSATATAPQPVRAAAAAAAEPARAAPARPAAPVQNGPAAQQAKVHLLVLAAIP